MTARDALAAHARDELGLSETTAARPAQAALASAASFSIGAAMPMAVVLMASPAHLIPWVSVASLGFLASLGALSARVGGAQIWRAMWRVAFWGAAAMAVTAAAGALFGAVARPADGLSHSDPAGRNLLPAELVRGCAEQRLLRRASHHESGASVRCRTDFGKARA